MNSIFETLQIYVGQCLNLLNNETRDIFVSFLQKSAVSCDFNYAVDEVKSRKLIETLFSKSELDAISVIVDNIIRYGKIYDDGDRIISMYYNPALINTMLSTDRNYFKILLAMAYVNYSHVAHMIITQNKGGPNAS